VDVRVQLESLDPMTAAAYLAHRLQCAGGVPTILEPAAVNALHTHGRGIPGLMNTLADNALFEAFLCGRSAVSATDVERAHRDLGWEVPAPGAAPEPASPVCAAPAAAQAAVPAAPAAAPFPNALEDLDSELEAVFEPAQSAAPAESAPVDPTSPEAIASLAPAPGTAAEWPVTPRDGPPKDESDVVEDLLVELLDD
jgi:hypothetical protein